MDYHKSKFFGIYSSFCLTNLFFREIDFRKLFFGMDFSKFSGTYYV